MLREVSTKRHLEDVLEAIRCFVDDDLACYTGALTSAFELTSPIFASQRYSDFFWHCASTVPGWLAGVVLANAEKESEGSIKLWTLWQQITNNREVEDGVLRHARDESRHSRLFLELSRQAFPSIVDSDLTAELDKSLPDVRKAPATKQSARIPEPLLIDHLVQMNIGEIRTRIHMELLAPVIHAMAPEEHRLRVRNILEGLVIDEVRHIGYTARLMEQWARSGDGARIRELYAERLHDFDRITLSETEAAVHAYGHGRFPELLEV